MDTEDRGRTQSNKAKLLAALRERGVITNIEAMAIGGSRAMGRIWELKQALGADVIQVRKLAGARWEIRYQQVALARAAETPVRYPDADCGPLFRTPAEQGAYQR